MIDFRHYGLEKPKKYALNMLSNPDVAAVSGSASVEDSAHNRINLRLNKSTSCRRDHSLIGVLPNQILLLSSDLQ